MFGMGERAILRKFNEMIGNTTAYTIKITDKLSDEELGDTYRF